MVFVSLKQYNVCTTGYEGIKYNEQEYRSLQTLKWVLIGHKERGRGGRGGRERETRDKRKWKEEGEKKENPL